jgi:hypothetical protein
MGSPSVLLDFSALRAALSRAALGSSISVLIFGGVELRLTPIERIGRGLSNATCCLKGKLALGSTSG